MNFTSGWLKLAGIIFGAGITGLVGWYGSLVDIANAIRGFFAWVQFAGYLLWNQPTLFMWSSIIVVISQVLSTFESVAGVQIPAVTDSVGTMVGFASAMGYMIDPVIPVHTMMGIYIGAWAMWFGCIGFRLVVWCLRWVWGSA